MIHSKITYLDLSGYSFTGKSAYNNLIAEFEGFHTHAFDFEFDLLRTKDGIVDLYAALIENWSPVRSSETLRGFKQLIRAYGGNKSFADRLMKTGRHYDHAFPGFTEISEKYIDDLIDASWQGQWPYAFEKTPVPQMVFYKLLYNLGFKNIFEAEVFLSSPSKEYFIARTKRYLEDILSSSIPSDTTTVVMNNVFEPFHPAHSLPFFDKIKSIIIDRDPRDIYLAAWNYTNKDGSKGWKATLGKDVADFVQRFRLYRKNVDKTAHPDILRVTFEDLILDYDRTVNTLYGFLEIDPSVHTKKRECFDPTISGAGVGMWKNSRRQSEIDYIHEHLNEYCKDY